jgi:hypothetical protein
MLKQMLSSMEQQTNGCNEEEGMRNLEKLKREEGTCLWGCMHRIICVICIHPCGGAYAPGGVYIN